MKYTDHEINDFVDAAIKHIDEVNQPFEHGREDKLTLMLVETKLECILAYNYNQIHVMTEVLENWIRKEIK